MLEKYRLRDSEARLLTDFLEPMLRWKPKDRLSAREMLNHPWLKEKDEYNVWMSKNHLKEFKIVNNKQFPNFIEELKKENEKEQRKA